MTFQEWFTNILIRIVYLKLCQMQKGSNNRNCEYYYIIIYDLLCTWMHVRGLLLDCVSLMQTHNCFYFWLELFSLQLVKWYLFRAEAMERMYNLSNFFLQHVDIWISEDNFIICVFIFSKAKILATLNLCTDYEQKIYVIFHWLLHEKEQLCPQ